MYKRIILTLLLASSIFILYKFLKADEELETGKTPEQKCMDWIYIHCEGQEAAVENCRTSDCLGDAKNGLDCINKCMDIDTMSADKYCFFSEPCIDMKSKEYKEEI